MQLTNTATWTEAVLRNGDYNRLRHWLMGADYNTSTNALRFKEPVEHVTAATATSLRVESTNAGAQGPTMDLVHNGASPADADVTARLRYVADDVAGTERSETMITNSLLTAAAADFSTQLSFWVANGGSQNEAVRIKEDQIHVDAASAIAGTTGTGNVFDDWDDADVLQLHNARQADQAMFWAKTDEMGITTRKIDADGVDRGERMMNLVGGIKLGWGAAAQNREAIDQIRDVVREVAREALGMDDPFTDLPLNAADRGSVIDVTPGD
ncbi:MAG: hypothetical protein HN396_10820 [Gemmatimonadales bacterium]|jgi:hypothetical protein|nr:hypothetical protein [Gemmatimonadales bacterium]